MSIDMLPDEVLLAIFDFCVVDEYPFANDDKKEIKEIEAWQSLVHVCQRWRSLVFGSPHRLNLRLVCTSGTPARDTLDVWPALPLLILASIFETSCVDNIIAVLERSDCVCGIYLVVIPSSQMERVSTAMRGPFPMLTNLRLHSDGENDETPVLPDSFLGGSAPRLQQLWLERISFPGLPKLLLSATRLYDLSLYDIPHSGYLSPDAMVTALSTLTCLEYFLLQFQSPQSSPYQESRRPPPLSRSVLPVLTDLKFKGVSEYLDDLVARIDSPRLKDLDVTFFNQIVFDTPQLVQFIGRTQMLKTSERASVTCSVDAARVSLSPRTSSTTSLNVEIPCMKLDWQISSLEQVFTSCLPPLSTLEDFYIDDQKLDWQDNIENSLWLELLRPFATVENLYLSKEFARRIVPALQELVGGRTTEVLPALQNIFLEGLQPSGSVQRGIGQFAAARRAIGHPIAVSHWDRQLRGS